MIKEETLNFLWQLKYNNNRDWFESNRRLYEKASEDIKDMLSSLIHEIAGFDSSVSGLKPKDCLFRIYRDIRFSRDKTPYKTHFGALIAEGGKSAMNPTGYYIHIDPGNTLAFAGLFHPDREYLEKIRKKISDRFEEFSSIINETKFKKNFGKIGGEKLKKLPRGFDNDDPAAEYLKHKEFLAISRFSDSEAVSEDFVKKTAGILKTAVKFNGFFRE